MKTLSIGLLLLLTASWAMAQQPQENLEALLPAENEVVGWTRTDLLQSYRGDDLFMMIDGGADIYHEYGFVQVLETEYVDDHGKAIKLEIYEMESPAAAYGIYSFKVGDDGELLDIGQQALLEDYYLNFWKGNLLVTVVGMDADDAIAQGVIDLARAVDKRYSKTGERAELATLLLQEPLAFSNPEYVLGDIGVMNSYIFDTENIFHVREGMVGVMNNCAAFVFRYQDEQESYGIYEQATKKISLSSRFTDGVRNKKQYSMIDREQNFVLINQWKHYISIVVGQKRNQVETLSNQLLEKLNINF